MRGEIDNVAFDEEVFQPAKGDASLVSIQSSLWFLYDDITRHRITADQEQWELLRRTIAFLKTDLHLPPPKVHWARRYIQRGFALYAVTILVVAAYLAFTRSRYWLLLPGAAVGVPLTSYVMLGRQFRRDDKLDAHFPFATSQEFDRYMPLADDEAIPSFDPAIHSQPIRSSFASWIMTTCSLPVVVFVLSPFTALIPLFFLFRKKSRAAQ